MAFFSPFRGRVSPFRVADSLFCLFAGGFVFLCVFFRVLYFCIFAWRFSSFCPKLCQENRRQNEMGQISSHLLINVGRLDDVFIRHKILLKCVLLLKKMNFLGKRAECFTLLVVVCGRIHRGKQGIQNPLNKHTRYKAL